MDERVGKSAELRRRLLEAGAWVLGAAFLWTIDTFSQLSVREQTGYGKDDFRLVTDQATSAVAALIMVLFVIRWLRMFPITKDQWVPSVIGHAVGTVIFAFGHYSLMVLFRAIVFSLNGLTYHWVNSYVPNLIVEYQKDIKIYLAMVLILSAYRYYRRTRRIELVPAPGSQRLLVQTGAGETVVRYEHIEYLEASRNYVVVHTGTKEYLIRDTISNLESRLSGGPFARIHRSYVVNIDAVAETMPTESGYRVRLTTGVELPLSRRYRPILKERMLATPAPLPPRVK